MRREPTVVLYVALMVAVVVAVDFLFFRGRIWERLMVNIGMVLVFAAFYLRFLKLPRPRIIGQVVRTALTPPQSR